MPTVSELPQDHMAMEQTYFFSRGVKVAAELCLPENPDPGGVFAVVCHGFGGKKSFVVPDIARQLATHGIGSIIFDYRGFGESDGAPQSLFPEDQVEDARAAVSWVLSQHDAGLFTAKHVVVFGISFGGGVAVRAASLDERIHAAVSVGGPGDCFKWLRDMRPYWEWRQLLRELEVDRKIRAETGQSQPIENDEVLIRDPDSQRFLDELRKDHPESKFSLTLECVDAILAFKPVEGIRLISPRSVLIMGVEEDVLVPFSQCEELYESAREPRELISIPTIAHHDIYSRPHIDEFVRVAARFLKEHLSIEGGNAS